VTELGRLNSETIAGHPLDGLPRGRIAAVNVVPLCLSLSPAGRSINWSLHSIKAEIARFKLVGPTAMRDGSQLRRSRTDSFICLLLVLVAAFLPPFERML